MLEALAVFQPSMGWLKADAEENICAMHCRMAPKRAGEAHDAEIRQRARHEPPQQASAAPTGHPGRKQSINSSMLDTLRSAISSPHACDGHGAYGRHD